MAWRARLFLPYIVAAIAAGIGGGILASLWAPDRWVTSYAQRLVLVTSTPNLA